MQPTVDVARFQSIEQGRRGRLARRLVVGALAVFLLLGVFGVWGTRQAHRTASADGYEVRLSYPQVTRGGLPTSWAVDIRRLDGRGLPPVELTTTAVYFDAFDHNELAPTPDRFSQTDVARTWEYDATDDDELHVELDVRTQPNARWFHDATTTVVVEGVTVASFDYRTFAMP